MHGWPHTFALPLELALLLPDFHVVVPSMPGFAFSAPYDGTMTESVMARLMHTLMTGVLGYDRYLTYGKDISAKVSDLIASAYPAHVQGTRPDTLAAALNDSPAGLIAWIAEKLVEWSDTPTAEPRALERRISRERIIAEAMISGPRGAQPRPRRVSSGAISASWPRKSR